MPVIEEKMLTRFSCKRNVPMACLLLVAAAETVEWARIVEKASFRAE
jgi:hypothetical protein